MTSRNWLAPGRHVLAVDGFNDRLEAGLIFGLHIRFADRLPMDVVSDPSWFVVAHTRPDWNQRTTPRPDWRPAILVGGINHHPWGNWPIGLTVEPPLLPLVIPFWQTGWFQLSLLTLLLLAIGACLWLQAQLTLQARSPKLLHCGAYPDCAGHP